METSERIDETRAAVRAARGAGQVVGVVPTMGALHEGHVSLMHAARAACDFVVTTIFVNPTQFSPDEDLDRYPRTLEPDLDACREAGVDLVFHPRTEAMYPAGATSFVEVGGLTEVWEGAARSGHFRGVTTVVLKLFNITEPDVAFFGQKDYQQQLVIRRMCRDLDLPVRIETCPIVRETDGLALSSRNRYLDPAERQSALHLSESLERAADVIRSGGGVSAATAAMRACLDADSAVRTDYAVIADPETLAELTEDQDEMVALVAAQVGSTRLIDNLLIAR